ncbi:hypothetical protein GCM10023339_46560 [Alloalcanivorax gelatiniphagus]
MTATLSYAQPSTAAGSLAQRTTVAMLLAQGLALLGERVRRDGSDAHSHELDLVARAVRPMSDELARQLANPFVLSRVDALAGAGVLLLRTPSRHAELAVALTVTDC